LLQTNPHLCSEMRYWLTVGLLTLHRLETNTDNPAYSQTVVLILQA